MAEQQVDLAKKISRPFGIAEDLLGFVLTNVTTVFVGCIFLTFSNFGAMSESRRTVISYIAISWLALDLPYAVSLWRAMFRGPRPATQTAASSQRTMSRYLPRLLIALWWLAHFVLGAAFMVAFHVAAAEQRMHETKSVPEWLTAVLAMCVGFAANGYLLLSVCALTRREGVRRIVWRSRGFIDIALGLLGLFVSRQMV